MTKRYDPFQNSGQLLYEILEKISAFFAGEGETNTLMRGYIKDGVSRVPRIDSYTNSLRAINEEQHEVNLGQHFYVAGYGDFDNGEDVDFQLTTPNTNVEIHMTFVIQGTAVTTIHIYEDADVDADGGDVTPYNNDRNSLNVSDLVLIQTDGTVNVAGNNIYAQSVGSATNPSKISGGLDDTSRKLILKKDTTYRFVIASETNGNIISYIGEWSEQTPID